MAAIATAGRLAVFKPQLGNIGVCYVQLSNYSSDRPAVQKLNLASLKRGTGGRSSFNGIVATVFGNSGFVGRYVVNRLGKIGTQIILPYRCDFYDVRPLKVAGDLGQVLFQPFDLRDEQSIEKSLRYSNVVINLIGRDYETNNFSYDDVHVKGARRLAKIAREAGVQRFIHLSYLNASPDPEPIMLENGSNYMRSQYHGVQAVQEEFPDATIIKAAEIYGAEDRFLRMYSSLHRRTLTFMPLWYKGERTEKQPIEVGDVAGGIVAAMLDRDAAGQTYQAVGPKRYKLSDLMDWFYAIMLRDEEWGYRRIDLRYDFLYQMRVNITERMAFGKPLGNVCWESMEREHTSDVVLKDVPTLEDLGINLTPMENVAPWILRQYRIHRAYQDELGEFPVPPAPPTVLTN